jgi:AraC-like DNA-binding protein
MDETLMWLSIGGGFFVGLFIAVLVTLDIRKHGRQNAYLGAILVISSVNLIHPHLGSIGSYPDVFSSYLLFEPMQFLLFPLFFFYVRTLVEERARFRLMDILHFIPAFGVIMLSNLEWVRTIENAGAFPVASTAFWLLLVLQALLYLHASRRIIETRRERAKELFSTLQSIDEGWIKWILGLIVLIFASYLLSFAFLIHKMPPHLLKAWLSLSVACAIWAIGIRVLRRPPIIAVPKAAPAAGRLNDEEEHLLHTALIDLMERQKLFRDPGLSLDDLVKTLGFSRNEISWVINRRIGKNFYQFINEYRVAETVRLFSSSENFRRSVLDIALAAGFNSKPAFNKIFKEQTGETPSQYRKQIRYQTSTSSQ